MVDVRGDVLRSPHCTTPAAVKENKNKSSFKSNEHIHKKEVQLFMSKCYIHANLVKIRQLVHEILDTQSKKISNDQELIQSDPISWPQNQKGNN